MSIPERRVALRRHRRCRRCARRRRAGAARRIRPTIPAVLEERDALIDKIARGEDVDASVRASPRSSRSATASSPPRARPRRRRRRRALRRARVQGGRTQDRRLTTPAGAARSPLDPKNPVPSDEGRFRGDWGRVVKKEAVRLTPKNALDEGEPATLYEVAGQARHYFIRGDELRRRPPISRSSPTSATWCSCATATPASTTTPSRPTGAAAPTTRRCACPTYWRGKLQRHGFAARIAAPPKIAGKRRWNPHPHHARRDYFWAIKDVKWKYPRERLRAVGPVRRARSRRRPLGHPRRERPVASSSRCRRRCRGATLLQSPATTPG